VQNINDADADADEKKKPAMAMMTTLSVLVPLLTLFPAAAVGSDMVVPLLIIYHENMW